MAYVYRHIRLDKNEPFYIGIGSDNSGGYTRAKSLARRSNHWRNVVNKTQYSIDILIDNIEWGDACKKEIEFIKLYGRKNIGTGCLVNLTDGGEGLIGLVHKKHTEETKKKIGEASKGNKHSLGRKLSIEHREKISMANKRRKPSDFCIQRIKETQRGRPKTEKQLQHIRQLNKGKKMPDWLKEKLRLINTGRTMSKESIEKSRIARVGKKRSQEFCAFLSNLNKGRIRPQESIEKQRISMLESNKTRKYYTAISPTGEYISFLGLAKFCRDNNLGTSSMCNLLNGKINIYKGWTKPQ